MDELIMAIDEAGFRKAMSCFASGVTVVTTEHDGVAYGMTVSAFSSLSLVPPLVLICVEKSARIHDAIPKAERFAVNILR
ncbi:MAG TPA: flavin reductase family protein, partial [Thermoanaerobaculia bacterium]